MTIRSLFGLIVLLLTVWLPSPGFAASAGDLEKTLIAESGVQDNTAFTAYPELGVEFRYPADVPWIELRKQPLPADKLSIGLRVEPVADLASGQDGPEISREEAQKEQEALSKGEFGDPDVDFVVDGSRKVVPLAKGVNAKTFVVLSRFEVCDLTFDHVAIFYWNNCRFTLHVSGPVKAIVSDNPELFFKDKANCGEALVWNYPDNASQAFFKKLLSGSAGKHAERWSRLFDQVLQDIRFENTLPKPAVASDPRVCRDAAAFMEKRSSGMRPLPEKSLAVRIPPFGDVCLLVAEQEQTNSQALFLVPDQAKSLQALPLASQCSSRIRELRAVDLNRDDLSEILVLADCADKPGKSANRVFWSSPNALGVEWLHDPEKDALVKNAGSADDMEHMLHLYLAELQKNVSKTIRIEGRFVKVDSQLRIQTSDQTPDTVYEVVGVPENFAELCGRFYDRNGTISAVVRGVERTKGVSLFQLEVSNCR